MKMKNRIKSNRDFIYKGEMKMSRNLDDVIEEMIKEIPF